MTGLRCLCCTAGDAIAEAHCARPVVSAHSHKPQRNTKTPQESNHAQTHTQHHEQTPHTHARASFWRETAAAHLEEIM